MRVGHRVARQSAGPQHAGDDVGVEAAAFAEHAHRQDHHVAADRRHADAVVRRGTDEARHLRAVPGAVPDIAVLERGVAVDFRLGDPVARVRRIRIAAIAVVRSHRVGDEVVARVELADEIGVIEAHSRVEHRDDNAAGAGCRRPCGLGVDRRHIDRVRRPQVPLSDRRRRADLVAGVQRIVGDRANVAPLVRLGELDIGVGREARCQAGRAQALREHDLRTLADRVPVSQRNAGALRQRGGQLWIARRGRVRRQRAHQRAARLVHHDHPRRLRCRCRRLRRRRRREGVRRMQRRRGEQRAQRSQGQQRMTHRGISGERGLRTMNAPPTVHVDMAIVRRVVAQTLQCRLAGAIVGAANRERMPAIVGGSDVAHRNTGGFAGVLGNCRTVGARLVQLNQHAQFKSGFGRAGGHGDRRQNSSGGGQRMGHGRSVEARPATAPRGKSRSAGKGLLPPRFNAKQGGAATTSPPSAQSSCRACGWRSPIRCRTSC